MNNVYYSPEKFGLEIAVEVEADLSYEFDKFVVWTDGEHFYSATDSGCSCPSPFEDLRVEDLMGNPEDAQALHRYLDEWAEHAWSVSAADVADAHVRITELFRERAAA